MKIHLERITREDKKLANDLNYDRIGFPVWEKDFGKIEIKNNLLLVTHENKPQYGNIKDFDGFMFHKTKNKSCLQCFSCKSVLTEHKEVCLSISGVKSVRSEKGTLQFNWV